MATVTLTSDVSANAATALTLSEGTCAANDILGIVVTQGTTANLSLFTLQFEFQLATVDAAADMTASSITSV